jgi:hypothetical protein
VIDIQHHRLGFTASSARQFLDQETGNHPLAVAGLVVLERLGQAQALRARLLEMLENRNEDPGRFRVTSRYVVATARPPARCASSRPSARMTGPRRSSARAHRSGRSALP